MQQGDHRAAFDRIFELLSKRPPRRDHARRFRCDAARHRPARRKVDGVQVFSIRPAAMSENRLDGRIDAARRFLADGLREHCAVSLRRHPVHICGVLWRCRYALAPRRALRPLALADCGSARGFLPASASLPFLVRHALRQLARPLRVVGLETLDCGDERAATVAYLGVPALRVAWETAPRIIPTCAGNTKRLRAHGHGPRNVVSVVICVFERL